MSRVIKSGDIAIKKSRPAAPLRAPTANAIAEAAVPGAVTSGVIKGPDTCAALGTAAVPAHQKVIDEARETARLIIEEAEKAAAAVEAQMLSALEAVKAEGFEEGLRRAEAECSAARGQAARELKSARAKAAEIIAAAEPEIIEIALAIAKKVIKREAASDRDIVMANVRDVLRRIDQEDTVTIKTSSLDAGVVEEEAQSLAREFNGIREIIVQGDERMERGGCSATMSRGTVDASVEAQVTRIRKTLMEEIGCDDFIG